MELKKEEIIAIPLNKGATLFVDREVWEKLKEFQEGKWYLHHQGYAIQTWNKILSKQISTLAHQLVWKFYEGEIPKGYELDLINQNKLDCRISNLRLATRSQNRMNTHPIENKTSKYKGVSFFKRNGKWRAQIKIDKRLKHLGYFDSEELAAQCYNRIALNLFGEFACINDMESPFIEGL